jgi:RND family efflux transporter MFP subunit
MERDVDTRLLSALRIDGEHREVGGRLRPRWLLLGGAVVVIAALFASAAWWVLAAPAIPVQTVAAVVPSAAGSPSAVLQATGYVTARRRATVSAPITGTLLKVLIEEGDRVEKGQVIARLEDSALRAALTAAQAHVRTIEAQVTVAEAQLAQAQADAKRQSDLAANGMVSTAAAEQARTVAATAAAQLEARRREAEAARAQAAQAKVNFDYTVIRAPFAGVVTEKAAQVGEIVSPHSAGGGFTRTGIGTIVDMDSLEVEVDVNEANLDQVQAGMHAEARLASYPDWRIPARVVAIVPAADRGKATVRVRIALEEKDARILPDAGVRVTFLGGRSGVPLAPPQGVLVPAAAVMQKEGASVVFVVSENRAALRTVATAPGDIGQIKLILDGVAVGERVVVAPPPGLKDGMRVRVSEASE